MSAPRQSSLRRPAVRVATLTAAGSAALLLATAPAGAAPTPIGLGTADSFAVLAGTTITNTGPSTISGDVGVSPGETTPGLTSAMVTGGTIHADDAAAASAQSDLTTAYDTAAGEGPPTSVPADLAGSTLQAGVYSSSTLALSGTLTLDAQGDPAATFVLQSASTLVLATASSVVLTNGADACHVFWQVGSSATLGTDSSLAGSVLALTAITAGHAASVQGRLLARNAAVTLDDNDITRPDCASVPGESSPPVSPTPTDPSSPTPTITASTTPAGTPDSSAGSTAPSAPASASTPTGAPGSGPVAGTVSPPSGPTSGGTIVSVTGSGFVPGGTVVTIGSTTLHDVDVSGSTGLTFVAPAHVGGSTSIVISTRYGSTRPGQLTFTYVDTFRRPAATGIDTSTQVVGAGGLLAAGLALLALARRPRRGRHAAG